MHELHQLLERYPKLTVQRAFEELKKVGYAGSYSTVRTYIKAYRPKIKARVVRFETAPSAQAQMDWSTYTIDFQQEGRRRVEDQLHIYNASIDLVAEHNLLRGRNQKHTSEAHLPPKDYAQQLTVRRT